MHTNYQFPLTAPKENCLQRKHFNWRSFVLSKSPCSVCFFCASFYHGHYEVPKVSQQLSSDYFRSLLQL